MKLPPLNNDNPALESYFSRITTGSKAIYWIIIGAVVVLIAALPFIHIDISVQARGLFQSEIEKQLINTPYYGKVIYSSIQTGKKVMKGDTLLVIDSEGLRAQCQSLEKRIQENNASLRDLEMLAFPENHEEKVSKIYPETDRFKSEYNDFLNRHSIQVQKLRKALTDHERNRLLHLQQIIPDAEFENSSFSYNTELENLKQIIITFKTGWQSELSGRRNNQVILEADLRKLDEEISNRVIISPVDGDIVKSAEIQAGTFLSSDQNIVEISPAGDLLAVCLVKPADIGFIYEKQPVRIQVDAFRYNEWGMLNGYVSDISDDLFIQGEKNAWFRVKCRLESEKLSLKNGYEAEMKKGMSLTARLFVTRRSLFNLLFDKADNWLNPYMNKKLVADED